MHSQVVKDSNYIAQKYYEIVQVRIKKPNEVLLIDFLYNFFHNSYVRNYHFLKINFSISFDACILCWKKLCFEYGILENLSQNI